VSAALSGDGWQANKLFFTSAHMTHFTTLEAGFVKEQSICLPDGTYTPFACGGQWPSEVSWDIPSWGIFGGADTTCTPGAEGHASFTIGESSRDAHTTRTVGTHQSIAV
jgi:hypothetical protein